MKKTIAVILALITCLFSVSVVHAARLVGDVNNDSSVNSVDAAQVLKHDALLLTLEGTDLKAGDVNFDGIVNSLDAALILKYDAFLIDGFGTLNTDPNAVINIDPVEKNTFTVPPITTNTETGARVDAIIYDATLTVSKEVDEYTYLVVNGGTVRVEISELRSGNYVELYVYDSYGSIAASDTYCGNGEGVTLNGVKSGEVYTIKVKQYTGFPDYRLTVYQPKAVVDVSGLTTFRDSVEHNDQRNVYTYTPAIDGRYRFEISDLRSGVKVELYVYDDMGYLVDSDTYCGNGEGVTLKELEANKVYEIQVRQYSDFGEYTLNIGEQKPTVDVSDYWEVKDSIQYNDQRNVYSFTVPVDGRYRFEIADMISGMRVELYVFDDMGYNVGSDTYCGNGEGVTLKDLKAGEVYSVQVREHTEYSNYTLKIWKQKPVTEISSKTESVFDSIEHVDQRNVYEFTVDAAGSYTYEIAGLKSGCRVQLYAFDQLGNTVDSDTYAGNGDKIELKNLKVGESYNIQVRYNSGFCDYELKISHK